MPLNIARCVAIAVMLVLASCTGTWVKAKYQKAGKFATWVDTPQTEYTIVPGDDLQIVMPLNPELNYEGPVAPDGSLTIPLGGTIAAGGLTAAQIGRNIDQAMLTRGISKMTYASVSVRVYAGHVFIGGQVKKPGLVALQSGMDVLQAITAAGGLMDTARSGQVVIIRRSPDGRPMLHSINLNDLMRKGDVTQAIVVKPFDTIFVPMTASTEADQFVDRYITRIVPFNQSVNYNIGQGGFFK